jgi:hypothetical protein
VEEREQGDAILLSPKFGDRNTYLIIVKLLIRDIRVKNSAPKIDLRLSAHPQVRALWVQTTHKLDDTASPKRCSDSLRITKSNIPQSMFSLLTCDDSADSTKHCSDDEEEATSKASPLPDPRLVEKLNACEASCPVVLTSFGQEQSCNLVCSHETTGGGFGSLSSFDHDGFSDNEHEFLNVTSSNLSENEYEELLRVYREKVW